MKTKKTLTSTQVTSNHMESEHTCTLALVILLLAAHRHVYYIILMKKVIGFEYSSENL